MVLQAVPVLQHEQAVLVDQLRVDRGLDGRLAAGKGNVEAVVEQRRLVHVAAGIGHGEEHAVELSTLERVAGGLARLLAQEQLQIRPLLAKSWKHCRQQEGRDRWDDAEPKLAVKRLALCPGHVGQLLSLAQDAKCLFRDLRPQGCETDDAPSPFDEDHAKRVFKLPQASRQGGLSHEAGLRSLAEMAVLTERNEILELLDRW